MKPLRIFSLAVVVVVCLLGTVAGTPEDSIRSRIKREPVLSSNVARIGYSRHLRALEIEFTRGAIYRFLEVPKSVYLELKESNSKGHFIAQNLRDRYRFVRVRSGKMPSHQQLAAHD